MPRTNGQAKRKTPAKAQTSTKAQAPSRAPARRRAGPPPPVPEIPEDLPDHATLLPPPPEAPYRLPAPPEAADPGAPAALSPTVAAELTALWPDLQALAHWWHARQALAQQDETPDRQLVRQTYHIEQRYIEAVKREAGRTGESYAAVVNRAFAQYFTGQ